jgi:excisionase family DNA binding protein
MKRTDNSNKKGETMENKLLTVRELAKMLELSPQTIYKKVHENKISYFHVWGSIRFKKEDIDKYLNEHKEEERE